MKNESAAVMLPNVRTGEILGLVETTRRLGSPLDLSRLAIELGAKINTLLPILDAAEMLGLLKVEGGVVALTEFGIKFQNATKNKLRLVRDQLAKIEPFNTALALSAHRHTFSSDEVAETLSEKGVQWHQEPEVNQAVVRGLLIDWAIHAGLLQYIATDKFRKGSTQM